MGRDKGAGEKLGAEEGEVVTNWEGLGFCVKMMGVCHLHTTGGYPEG